MSSSFHVKIPRRCATDDNHYVLSPHLSEQFCTRAFPKDYLGFFEILSLLLVDLILGFLQLQGISDVAINVLRQIYDGDSVRIFDDDGTARKIVKLEILWSEISSGNRMGINPSNTRDSKVNFHVSMDGPVS